MLKPIRKMFAIGALASLLIVCNCAFAEVAVIVNADNNEEIDLATVIRIYLAQIAKFPSGDEARPVAQPDGSKVRGDFSVALLKAAPAAVKSYWAQQQFTGGLKPLPTYNTDEAVMKAVAESPDGIGYVDAAKVRGNVRVALKL